jgi:hypothetical protein
VTTAIAIYAALVSTGVLVLELVREWRSWSTRVAVTVHPRMVIARAGEANGHAVVFKLINHSAHAVKITHVGMEPLRKGGDHVMFTWPLGLPAPGPFEIPPRDAVTLHQRPDDFRAGDPRHKTRLIIATSDGKKFRSKRVRVQELVATNARSK